MRRQEHLADFTPYPWCQKVLSSPDWLPQATRSTSTNRFFTETLWTDVTIRAHASFYKPPNHNSTNPNRRRGAAPGYCHGGMLALLIDDIIHELVELELKGVAVTATLSISYRRPVETPAVLLCRVWSEKEPVGRKWVVRATIEDGVGGVYLECESLVVRKRNERL